MKFAFKSFYSKKKGLSCECLIYFLSFVEESHYMIIFTDYAPIPPFLGDTTPLTGNPVWAHVFEPRLSPWSLNQDVRAINL